MLHTCSLQLSLVRSRFDSNVLLCKGSLANLYFATLQRFPCKPIPRFPGMDMLIQTFISAQSSLGPILGKLSAGNDKKRNLKRGADVLHKYDKVDTH